MRDRQRNEETEQRRINHLFRLHCFISPSNVGSPSSVSISVLNPSAFSRSVPSYGDLPRAVPSPVPSPGDLPSAVLSSVPSPCDSPSPVPSPAIYPTAVPGAVPSPGDSPSPVRSFMPNPGQSPNPVQSDDSCGSASIADSSSEVSSKSTLSSSSN